MTGIAKARCRACCGEVVLAAVIVLLTADALAQEALVGRQGDSEASRPLAHRYSTLLAQVNSLKEQIARLDVLIPQLEKQVDELIERTASLVPPEPKESIEPPPKAPRKVGYRTPIEQREKDLKTPVVFVCEEGRVAIFDLDAASRAQKKQGTIVLRPGETQTFDLEAGDFTLRITASVFAGVIPMVNLEGVRKAGHPGETLAEFQSPRSKVREHLRTIDSQAARAVVQFNVYPDSYEIFRAVRQLVWEKRFRVNWAPMSHGEKIMLGTGEGGIVHQ